MLKANEKCEEGNLSFVAFVWQMSAMAVSDTRAHAKPRSYQGLPSEVTSPPEEASALGDSSPRTDI